MRIANRVKKFQTIVLGVIVGMLAISLVFWGNVPGGGEEHKEVAGVIFGDHEVPWEEYAKVHDVVVPMIWIDRYRAIGGGNLLWGLYNVMQRRTRFEADVTETMMNDETWKYLLALREADRLGITVTVKEIQDEIKAQFKPFMRGQDFNMEQYAEIVELFYCRFSAFEKAYGNHMKIERLVDLMSEAEFPPCEAAFREVLDAHKKARIRYAEFNPDDYRTELRPVTEAEVARFYKEKKEAPEHRRHMEDPPKVVIEYLLVSFESLKEKAADPTEAEMKAYYEENKPSFEIIEEKKPEAPHEHKEGETHGENNKERKYKPFADVKEEIKGRLKLKKAETDLAYPLVNKIRGEIVVAMDKAKPGEQVDLAPVAEKNPPVKHDSLVVTEGRIKEAEEILGDGTELYRNFSHLGEGIFADVVRTSKGFLIYRLNKRIEKKLKPLAMDDVKEYIEKQLKKQQLKEIARNKAQDVSNEINQRGFSQSPKARVTPFKTTGYFESGEARAIGPFAQQAFSPALAVGHATLSDDPGSGKTTLVYLDDVTAPDAADAGREYQEAWSEKLKRSRYRQAMGSNLQLYVDYLKKLMEKSRLEDRMGRKKEAADGAAPKAPPASPPAGPPAPKNP